MKNDCIIWSGAWNVVTGYVKTGLGILAHRAAYSKANGPIPEGMVVRHTCDVRLCVEPTHLVVGTQQDNIDDCIDRGRFPRGSKQGSSKLNEIQVLRIKRRVLGNNESVTLVAREYGVSRSCINLIKMGRNWSHIPYTAEDTADETDT